MKYAQNTEVPPGESRDQITDLLRDWGVRGIRWSEDFSSYRVVLEFVWEHMEIDFHARMVVNLPTDDILEKMASHKRSKKVIPEKLDRLKKTRGWREHRVLYIFLKGAFEAIDNGIITAEQLFMPWLVGADGYTVGEKLAPRLPELMSKSALALLPGGEEQ